MGLPVLQGTLRVTCYWWCYPAGMSDLSVAEAARLWRRGMAACGRSPGEGVPAITGGGLRQLAGAGGLQHPGIGAGRRLRR